MPASLAKTLLLWSSLLFPGASAEDRQAVESASPPGHPGWAVAAIDATATIRPCRIGRDVRWILTEAVADEQDPSDGDEVAGIGDTWSPLPDHGRHLASAIRPDRGIVGAADRSPILRC